MQILAIDKISQGVTAAILEPHLPQEFLDFDLIPIGPLMPLGLLLKQMGQ